MDLTIAQVATTESVILVNTTCAECTYSNTDQAAPQYGQLPHEEISDCEIGDSPVFRTFYSLGQPICTVAGISILGVLLPLSHFAMPLWSFALRLHGVPTTNEVAPIPSFRAYAHI